MKKILVLPKLYKKWALLRQRTNLVLGLTYFELGDFERAIKYLSRISAENENYPRALLGLGWCYLKIKQYQRMVKPLEEFTQSFPQSEFLPEVYLLLGQAHLKIRLYEKSIYYFSKILRKFPSKLNDENLLEDIKVKMNEIKNQIEQYRLDLLLSESKLMDTIRLYSEKWIPRYMKEELKRLEMHRSSLLQRIQQERSGLNRLTQSLDTLESMVKIHGKDWRSYAEYGISRALFLKEQEK